LQQSRFCGHFEELTTRDGKLKSDKKAICTGAF